MLFHVMIFQKQTCTFCQQDIEAPDTVDRTYNGLALRTVLVNEDRQAGALRHIPGADGFSFDSSPLFQVLDY